MNTVKADEFIIVYTGNFEDNCLKLSISMFFVSGSEWKKIIKDARPVSAVENLTRNLNVKINLLTSEIL